MMHVSESILGSLRQGRGVYLLDRRRYSPGRRLVVQCGHVEAEVEVCAVSEGVDVEGFRRVLVRLVSEEVAHG